MEVEAHALGIRTSCDPDYVGNLTDRNTTVNQVVREFLESAVRQTSDRQAARERLLSRRYPIGAINWTRHELYER